MQGVLEAITPWSMRSLKFVFVLSEHVFGCQKFVIGNSNFVLGVNVTPFATKFVLAICCLVCVKRFFAAFVSEIAKFAIHQQYILSSVLSKICCLLKCSNCIDDIVCTKTGLYKSPSLIFIKDTRGPGTPQQTYLKVHEGSRNHN